MKSLEYKECDLLGNPIMEIKNVSGIYFIVSNDFISYLIGKKGDTITKIRNKFKNCKILIPNNNKFIQLTGIQKFEMAEHIQMIYQNEYTPLNVNYNSLITKFKKNKTL